MSRECTSFRSSLGGRLEDHASDSHLQSCASCREVYDGLRGLEVLARATGRSALPVGFAAEAARTALATVPAGGTTEPPDSLIERLIPLAGPTAAACVVCAIAVLLAIGWTIDTGGMAPVEDPVAQAVELPQTLGDPTLALLGGRE